MWAVVQQPQSGWTERREAATSDLLELVQGQLIGVEAHGSFAKALSTFEPLATHDVFHSIHLPLPPATSTGSAGRVLTVHDVLHLRRPDLYNSIGVPPIQRSIDSLAQDDIALCDSGQTRADLMMVTEHPGNQMITVPLGCSVATTIAPARARHDVTCLVQLAPRKNAQAVLAALTQVLADRQREEGPTAVGHVFTQNAGVEIAHKTARSAGIDPSLINVVANADDETIGAALARSRAFLWGSEYEGFGLPVLEAMAHGAVPVLAPNSSHIAVAGDSGAYAPAPDSISLAKVLHRLLSDSAYAEALSNRAVRRARSLSWRNTADQTVRAYAQARRLAARRANIKTGCQQPVDTVRDW